MQILFLLFQMGRKYGKSTYSSHKTNYTIDLLLFLWLTLIGTTNMNSGGEESYVQKKWSSVKVSFNPHSYTVFFKGDLSVNTSLILSSLLEN